jgi:arylsulfatase
VEQLFDLQADPREENDVVASPEQAERLQEMRERFSELKEEAAGVSG